MSGYDLLVTDSACFNFGGAGGLNLVPFVGVPLGTYNFGGGPKNVGATDTILHRLGPVTNLADGASQTINIAMVALSLQSQNQINWSAFGGNANEFVKVVNVVDLGSTMTIHNSVANLSSPNEFGTFDSIIKIQFQLQGLTSGATTTGIAKTFNQTNASWTQLPPLGLPLINGVNNHLNGLDHTNDFFTGSAYHEAPDGSYHSITPEPTSVFAIGLACMAAGGGFARRRRLQQAT